MTGKQVISQYDGTMVKVGRSFRRVDKGGALPDEADADHVKVLLDRGMVAEGEPTAGFVESDPVPPPFTVVDPDDVDGDGPIPAKSATKDVWIAYAVSQGADQADAEAATKDDLIATYGSA
jgi:hypothetical protein